MLFWLPLKEIVPLERRAASWLFMLLTSSTTALSHQVANYGMGGQYEPHFDFSRVRPKPPVLLKGPAPAGLRRLELLEALQPPRQAPLPNESQLVVTGEAQIWNHSPRQPGCFPCDVGVCSSHPTLSFFALTLKQRTSLGLRESCPCPLYHVSALAGFTWQPWPMVQADVCITHL